MVQNLQDLEVYQLSERLADDVWKIVIQWDFFVKDTIGKQLVRAADSISANISEGFGRYSYKENIQFCYYARGSLYETRSWIKKAKKRSLITDDYYLSMENQLELLGKKLNAFINSMKKQSDKKTITTAYQPITSNQ